MLYFDVSDAPLFFGREDVTKDLVKRLREQRFLAVVGASGSGKSSVVRAGLVAALKPDAAQHFVMQPPDGSARWQLHIITPTEHPLKQLAASLIPQPEEGDKALKVQDFLADDPRALDTVATQLLNQQSGTTRLLLVVDQFEELFTACKDAREHQAFIANLLHAVADDTAGPTRVVLTLRVDFYEHCAQFPALFALLPQTQVNLNAMQPDELRSAIERPAQLGEWEFETGLVELLLRDVGGGRGR